MRGGENTKGKKHKKKCLPSLEAEIKAVWLKKKHESRAAATTWPFSEYTHRARGSRV